ncbi:DUF1446-domain-containing protein [Hesseltinella vesiculosa]|uniref:DUF1446-domain-containing protein n=1 Tax=Hesseltinella vesiculosa TaxID=101127 RepID=A0A1X2GI11_9FUNG|nr:DUF1446-domain-containing protein [Hesseltinella vesiculosa]
MQTKPIRIGCCSAFWGDSTEAAVQLVNADIDYLVADFLAEITMGIFAAKRVRRGGQPGCDYVELFVNDILPDILPIVAKKGIKVVTNAGALDPTACKAAIESLLEKLQLNHIKVAAVVGDDLLHGQTTSDLASVQESYANTLLPFSPLSTTKHDLASDKMPVDNQTILSLNAYLGGSGIAVALDQGAQIVVTGRTVDSAIVVGPLLHEFKWQPQDPRYHDLLASASLAGHVIECGGHATGGNFTDWRQVAQSDHGGYANLGYPIAEFQENGEFIVTKPEKTGGLVSTMTVSEQILYETMDPARYIMPEVIVDLRQVRLLQVGKDRVRVTGAKGLPPTPWLKCCGIYIDTWQASGDLYLAGEEAKEKALTIGQAIQDRCASIFRRRGLEDFSAFRIEAIGGESLFGPHATSHQPREILLRLVARHPNPSALAIFAREINPMVTSGAPGTGFYGLPQVMPSMVHFPALIPKSHVQTKVLVGKDNQASQTAWLPWDEALSFGHVQPSSHAIPEYKHDGHTPLVKVKLIHVALARSGDKGDVSNIGVIARDLRYLPFIKRSITEEAVGAFMRHHCHGPVQRYELPGLNAFNFVLTHSLGGGGITSMIVDRQGKAFAQLILSGLYVELPASLVPQDPAKL